MVSRAQFAHKFEVQEHIMQPNARTERNAYGLKSTICAQNRGTRAYYAAKCSHIAKCVWSREHNLRTKSRHKSTYARTKSRHKSTICAHKIEAQEHNLCTKSRHKSTICAQNRGARAHMRAQNRGTKRLCHFVSFLSFFTRKGFFKFNFLFIVLKT